MATVKQKLENYWYHYKWHTIIGTVALILVIVFVVQCATRPSYTIQVMYTGPEQVEGNVRTDMEKAFTCLWQSKHPADKDGIALASIFLMSAQQLEAAGGTSTAASLMATERQKFFSFAGTGECLIYLLDPAWYAELKASDLLVKWEDSLGYRPENAMDDYAIRFWDTDFAKSFAKSFEVLPEDTVLCMRVLPSINLAGGKREQERYNTQLELFRALIEFSL